MSLGINPILVFTLCVRWGLRKVLFHRHKAQETCHLSVLLGAQLQYLPPFCMSEFPTLNKKKKKGLFIWKCLESTAEKKP